MVNFVSLAATATRLVKANGRSVVLTKKVEQPTTDTKPWTEDDELLVKQDDLSDVAWTPGGAIPPTVVSSTIVAPNGVADAFQVQFGDGEGFGAGSGSNLRQSPDLTTGIRYDLSVWAKLHTGMTANKILNVNQAAGSNQFVLVVGADWKQLVAARNLNDGDDRFSIQKVSAEEGFDVDLWLPSMQVSPPLDVTVTVDAAITNYVDEAVDGTLIKRGDRIAWIGPVSGQDITDFTHLVDGSERWQILNVEVLKPANTVVAYKLQLRR